VQDKGEVEIRYADNQAAFQLKDEKGSSILIISKLIEGNYPNYKQVIPGEMKERVALAREEFLHALRRAEIYKTVTPTEQLWRGPASPPSAPVTIPVAVLVAPAVAAPSPSPSVSPTPSPTPTPSPAPTPSPTETPSPTPTPAPS